MSESETPSVATEPVSTEPKCQTRRTRGPRRWIRRVLGLAVLLGLVSVPFAIAHASGNGFGGPGGRCHGAPESAEAVREHMDKGADFVLRGLDVTDAQRSSIDTTLDGLAPVLFASGEQGRALREDAADALANNDAAALEEVRLDTVSLFDSTSKRLTQAALQVASTLSPDQRAALAERLPTPPE